MSLSSFAAMSADPREHEVQILLELVRLSRLTLLVAESGSDKSTVLRTRVMPLLQQRSGGSVKEIPVLFDWWRKAPLAVLNARTDEALARVIGDEAYAMGDHGNPLCARLVARQQVFDCTFTIILDRFEEYLEAPPDDADVRAFEAQLVEAVNTPIVRANFVLSLDEAATPQLARLRERIPGLGDARVRLSRVEDEPTVLPRPHSAESAGGLVGSAGSPATFDAGRPARWDHNAAGPAAVEQAQKHPPISRTIEALFAGAEPPRPLHSHTAPIGERAESTGVHDDMERAATAAQPDASARLSSQEPVPDHSHDPQREIAAAPEPMTRSAVGPGPHEQATAYTARESQEAIVARATEARPQSRSTRAAVVIGVVIAILSSVALLTMRRGAAPAPDAVAPRLSTSAAENHPRADDREEAGTGAAAGQRGEAPVNGREAHGSAAERFRSSNETGTSFTAANDASQPKLDVEQSPTSALPPAASNAGESSPALAAQPGGPLLYIHIGSEAQRAYAESMIKPLARYHIRVSGIRVVSVGPPASDLQYFHSADRAEALRINRALDQVGRPAQRLNYVRGFEDRKPRSHFELWLPPTL